MAVTSNSKHGGEAENVSPPNSAARNSNNNSSAKDHEFSAFYRNSLSTLLAFLVMQGANISDATEIAQEAMSQAYQQWDQIKFPKAWCYTVARRALIKRHANLEQPIGDIREHESNFRSLLIESSQDELENWAQNQDLIRLFSTLPQRQRQVLSMTVSGLTPSEIAKILSTSPEAVRSTLRKSRAAAKSYFEKQHKTTGT